MKKLLRILGETAFWLAWPALWLYLRRGTRTRVLVEHDGKILMVKSLLGTGKWQLPGGGLHRNEDPSQGAIREVLEETGLDLRFKQLEPLDDGQTVQYAKLHGLSYKYLGFSASLEKKPPVHRPQRIEISKIGWLEPKDLNIKTVSKDVLAILEQWSTKH